MNEDTKEKPLKTFELEDIIFFADYSKIYKAIIVIKNTTEDTSGEHVTYKIKGNDTNYDGSRFFNTDEEAREFLKEEAVLKVDDYQTVDWTNL